MIRTHRSDNASLFRPLTLVVGGWHILLFVMHVAQAYLSSKRSVVSPYWPEAWRTAFVVIGWTSIASLLLVSLMLTVEKGDITDRLPLGDTIQPRSQSERGLFLWLAIAFFSLMILLAGWLSWDAWKEGVT